MKKSKELKNSQEILAQGTNCVQAEIHKHGMHRTDRHPKDTQAIQPHQVSGQRRPLCWHIAVQLLNQFILKCKPQTLDAFSFKDTA